MADKVEAKQIVGCRHLVGILLNEKVETFPD